MKTLSINQILETAKSCNAEEFRNYLEANAIAYEYLDANLTNLNEGWFQVCLFDYNDDLFAFLDGRFQED